MPTPQFDANKIAQQMGMKPNTDVPTFIKPTQKDEEVARAREEEVRQALEQAVVNDKEKTEEYHNTYTTTAVVQDSRPLPPAADVLKECMDLMVAKNHDYNNENSTVKHADHYRRGIDTIHDQLHQKLLRAQSLIEADVIPANESIEDTYKDMINYAAFAVTYLRGKMDGQKPDRDIYNRKKK